MNQEFIYGLYIFDNMNSVKQLYQTYTNPISAIKQIIQFIKADQYSTFANWFLNNVLLKNPKNVLDIMTFVKNNQSLASDQYNQFEQLIEPYFDDYCLYLSVIYHEHPDETKKSDKMDIVYPLFNEIKSLLDNINLDTNDFHTNSESPAVPELPKFHLLIQKVNNYIKNCENNTQIELLNKQCVNMCFYKTKPFDFKQLDFNHDPNIKIQVSQNGVTIGFGDYDYIIQTIKHISK